MEVVSYTLSIPDSKREIPFEQRFNGPEFYTHDNGKNTLFILWAKDQKTFFWFTVGQEDSLSSTP